MKNPVVTAIRAAAIVLLCLICALPLLWMILAAFKTSEQIQSIPFTLWPTSLDPKNFFSAFTSIPLAKFFVNSVIFTTVTTLVKVVLGICTAYAIVFIPIRGRNVLFLVIVASIMVPSEITALPNYMWVAENGLLDTFPGLILPVLGSATAVFLLRQSFIGIPEEIIQAAHIDGAGPFRTLWQIVLPMASPAIATAALLAIVAEWNAFMWPLLVSTDDSVRTLTVGIAQLQNVEGATNWAVVMAGATLVLIPMLLVFLIFQRRLVSGLTAGAVKS